MKRIPLKTDLEDRILSGIDAVSNTIDDAIHEVIETPSQWDEGFGVTRRKNGEIVVGSYRNIVDLGNLDQSQEMTRDGLKTTWEWDGLGETPAVLVYTGYTTKNGRVPGRQFPEKGVDQVDIQGVFNQGFNQKV